MEARTWKLMGSGGRNLFVPVFLVMAVAVGCSKQDASTPAASSSDAPQATNVPTDPNALQLTFVYGSEKKAWITDVTDAFNNAGNKTPDGKPIQVKAIPMGSGECVDSVLDGSTQADIISPASGAFIKLGNAQSRSKMGSDLIGSTDNLVLSPVVIAMWKPMAQALGWGSKPVGWADILAVAKNPDGWAAYGHPEWGKFKFGHTHPDYSNSGLISSLAIVYAGTGKTKGLTLDDVSNPATGQFMSEIESAVQHYGSSTGFFADKMESGGPGYLSAAVLYESLVCDSYKLKDSLPFPLVCIYPKEGTFWSDHPVGIVQRPWVTDDRKAAAKVYIDYLLAKPQQEKALTYGFRPADPSVPLAAPITADFGADPKEPMTTLDVPSADVMNAILQLWHQHKKAANIVLVFDTSGSMNDDNKISSAKGGAAQLLTQLDDADLVSLLPFSGALRWSGQGISMHTSRQQALNVVDNLIADGGTRLYDSIDAAVQYQVSHPTPDQIQAVVVLTDGQDTDSAMNLETLIRHVQSHGEHQAIRVFTIGYGHDADESVLKKIADVTGAKYYKGTPQNIKEVFRDIATFF